MKPWVLVAALSAIAGVLVASSGAGVGQSNSTCRSGINAGRCYYGRLSGSYSIRENIDYDKVNFRDGGYRGPCPLNTAHTSSSVVVEYFSPAKGPRVARFSAANPTGSPFGADTAFRAIPRGVVFLTVTYTRETKGYVVTGLGPPEADCKPTTYPVDTKCDGTKSGLVSASFDAYDGSKRGTAHLLLNGPTESLVSPACIYAGAGAGATTAAFTALTFKKSKFTLRNAIRGSNLTQPVIILGKKRGAITTTTKLQWTFCETDKIRPSACRP